MPLTWEKRAFPVLTCARMLACDNVGIWRHRCLLARVWCSLIGRRLTASTPLAAWAFTRVERHRLSPQHRELFHAIAAQLHTVVPDHLMLILNDVSTDEMRSSLEPPDTPFAPFVPLPLSDWGPARSAWDTQLTTSFRCRRKRHWGRRSTSCVSTVRE